PDLDIFGQGSLFQLLDETATRAGEEKLAGWLQAPAPRAAVLERQGAVRELAPMIDFRQALVAEGRLAAKSKADATRFLSWAEGGPYLSGWSWTRPLAWLLPALTIGLFLASQNGLLPNWPWWVALVAQFIVRTAARRALNPYYEQISMGEAGFVRFERTFATIET